MSLLLMFYDFYQIWNITWMKISAKEVRFSSVNNTLCMSKLSVNDCMYINCVIFMNPSLPLTCIRNNMMCIKTSILLLYKIGTEFGNFDIFLKLLE